MKSPAKVVLIVIGVAIVLLVGALVAALLNRGSAPPPAGDASVVERVGAHVLSPDALERVEPGLGDRALAGVGAAVQP